ncbi:MAG TPA: CmpA/NrtA family ABC transporter substrate-binding protein [Aliidongia sp.]|uniref:CmpA/NrtA family ABC transporter substrate-binding protein n=1 Tax=Aliidongia sp. TaxID=1914230 RepID=UPI002DDCB8B0|nr:CmpA/NrtA family ABC transporter substrate-binding protein [Aliidongia sp.]HEV2676509.1 CmpA/NrtA family ABC transporter substrate-binding protein [Aliidongia sp.]
MATDEVTRIRIGLVRLTDMAPAFVADAKGFFVAEGVDAILSIEPSWANIADKLTYRALDAAVMLPPLTFAVAAGLRGAGTPLIVPLSISQNGNAFTVSNALAEAVGRDIPQVPPSKAVDARSVGDRLARVVAARGVGARLRFAVVHAYSSHDLLLRYWLAACGIHPIDDVELVAVAPVDMVAALASGEIDGFCAGAPWGAVATADGVGCTILPSSAIWKNHPEKCFAVTADWAERHPEGLRATVRALLRAQRFCDTPANAEEIARLLSVPERMGVASQVLRASLPGGSPSGGVDVSRFFAGGASEPRHAHADWFLDQMARWGRFSAEVDRPALARAVYRPDVYNQVAGAPIELIPETDRLFDQG